MKRTLVVLVLGLLAWSIGASSADAGGWSVVTLDYLPREVVAGQPVEIGFMVRQHGRMPMSRLSPRITAVRDGSGETLNATAAEKGEAGHYVATLKFTSAGPWKWGIDAFGFKQPMPRLTVLATAPVKAESAQATEVAPVSDAANTASMPPLLLFALGVGGWTISSVLIVVWARQRSRLALGASLIAALAGLTGFALIAAPTALPAGAAQSKPQAANAPAMSATDETSLTVTQYGKELFLAKGCVVCHAHQAVNEERASTGLAGFHVGPDLSTRFIGTADKNVTKQYLTAWITNPSAIKAEVEMPTLKLSPEETVALVNFLLAGAQ